MRISSIEDLQVGDIGFTVIAGRVGGMISLGQGLIDVVNLVRGRDVEQSWFSHAYIVVHRSADEDGPYATILEAMPNGARTVILRGTDRIGRGYGYARLPLTNEQRIRIMVESADHIGVPYSFVDYLSIALLHLGLPRKLTAGYVRDSGHMICSQLVDYALCQSGFHVFDDGRVSQDVTPGALFHRAGAIGEILWW